MVRDVPPDITYQGQRDDTATCLLDLEEV